MTNPKAVEYFKEYLEFSERAGISPEYNEAQTLAIDALEKQVPKKVLNQKGLKNFNSQKYAIRGNCPVCGTEDLISSTSDYCYHCGQALDWEE